MKNKFLHLIGKYSQNEKFNLECWKEIYDAYTADTRHYHNLDHLENMFSELDKVISTLNKPDSVEFAIFYHDIVYNPFKSDNEYQSAMVFKNRIAETSFDQIDYCMTQIEATKAHKRSDDNDTNILLDLDLSILGSAPDRYKQYCKNIRKEYQVVPELKYRRGRRKVLEHFLHLDTIFKTEFFRNEYEQKARENLERELEELR